MNSSNPFVMMMNMINPMMNNPMSQMMNMTPIPMMPNKRQQNIPLNQNQFKQFLPNIDDNILQQLVQQAKQQGISDNDIQAGINFIKQLK